MIVPKAGCFLSVMGLVWKPVRETKCSKLKKNQQGEGEAAFVVTLFVDQTNAFSLKYFYNLIEFYNLSVNYLIHLFEFIFSCI